MERVPKGVFTKEFKEEAVKMVTEGGFKSCRNSGGF
jgi:transposase-like protein